MILFNYYYYLLIGGSHPLYSLYGWLQLSLLSGDYMDNFEILPESFVQKCKSFVAAKNTYLDVVDGRVSLVWEGSSYDAVDIM